MSPSTDPRALPTVQLDNELVRVTEWRFAPGASTGHHRHEYPYVVVPMTTGRLALISAAGAEHDVRNANAFDFAFIEIELKTG